jgi:hypothetical protein
MLGEKNARLRRETGQTKTEAGSRYELKAFRVFRQAC